jgi:predicted signal transduction protein with EAL and GGDEF domain
MAENLRTSVEQHCFNIGDGLNINVTCSIGFASYPFLLNKPDAANWQQVLDIADSALYAAKKSQRNAWLGINADQYQDSNIVPLLIKTPALAVNHQKINLLTSFNNKKMQW